MSAEADLCRDPRRPDERRCCGWSAPCAVCPRLCLVNRCQIVAAGSHDSVGVRTTSTAIGVRPSLEPGGGGGLCFETGARPRSTSLFFTSTFVFVTFFFFFLFWGENNNPHPGRPENKVQAKERESGAPVCWCRLTLTGNFFTSPFFFYAEALSQMRSD